MIILRAATRLAERAAAGRVEQRRCKRRHMASGSGSASESRNARAHARPFVTMSLSFEGVASGRCSVSASINMCGVGRMKIASLVWCPDSLHMICVQRSRRAHPHAMAWHAVPVVTCGFKRCQARSNTNQDSHDVQSFMLHPLEPRAASWGLNRCTWWIVDGTWKPLHLRTALD